MPCRGAAADKEPWQHLPDIRRRRVEVERELHPAPAGGARAVVGGRAEKFGGGPLGFAAAGGGGRTLGAPCLGAPEATNPTTDTATQVSAQINHLVSI